MFSLASRVEARLGFTAGLLLLRPPPVPFFLANASDLLANVIGDPLVHVRAVSKLEKDLEMNEEGSENESCTELVSGSMRTMN